MASLFRMDRILYQCGCDEWWPLCSLYFCRHCSTIRCMSCSLNEIDSTFCPNCLENIPAGEARVKKNRCVNCNQCPICGVSGFFVFKVFKRAHYAQWLEMLCNTHVVFGWTTCSGPPVKLFISPGWAYWYYTYLGDSNTDLIHQ
ncbi:unnamed protein product [Angiostrongylus costaricensis]|uniref:Dynactin subunit 4 n=1 Tax=Angiostrongylus costaricensis TaxID=334426 RepID=A0A0R3PSH1_ANGCS|nr:unnamed protein product [Angiostrongylus costaricensis]